MIDRYEAARARELIEWAALCAARNAEKEEAVRRQKAGQTSKKAGSHPDREC